MANGQETELREVLGLSAAAFRTCQTNLKCADVRELDAQLCPTKKQHVVMGLGSVTRRVEAFGLTPSAAHRLRKSLKSLVRQYLRGVQKAGTDVSSLPEPYIAELEDRYWDQFPRRVTGFEIRLQVTGEQFAMISLLLRWEHGDDCRYFLTISAAARLERLLREAVDEYLSQ